MALTGKFVAIWLAPEAIETVLAVLPEKEDTVLASWIVAGEIVEEAGPGVWVRLARVIRPGGEGVAVAGNATYFVRWDVITAARLYETMPEEVRGIG
jgi:hypothetical protein